MPTEEGLRLDGDQSLLPSEQAREKNHGQTSCIGGPPWLDFPFQIESQLFAKDNVFRFERGL